MLYHQKNGKDTISSCSTFEEEMKKEETAEMGPMTGINLRGTDEHQEEENA